MRIALLSDIHGNLTALEAVLSDAASFGVDSFWALGDLAAIGPEPVRVLERLNGLPGFRAVRGNTDRYVVTGEGPAPSLEDARDDPGLIDLHARVKGSFAWTRGFVTGAGWLEWMEGLPVEARMTLPDGSRLLGVHASPGRDEGDGIHPAQSDAELAGLVAGCGADIVCAGHTHEPVLRDVNAVRVANLGCVGNPVAPDLRASYVILDAREDGVSLHHRRVAYDHAAFSEAVHRSRHPEADFILSHQRGERPSRVPHADHVVPESTAPAA